MNRKQLTIIIALFSGSASLMGCKGVKLPFFSPNKQVAITNSVLPPIVKKEPALSEADLRSIKVNEAGAVPILEYHDIWMNETPKSLARSVSNFKHDLSRLYNEGYYPITMEAYLTNKIDVPAGKTPVILTFDDARTSQFKYLPDGKLDPHCALAIMQGFHQEHPDFPLKATFFVLPKGAFGQPKYIEQKLKDLHSMGFEIGNHTVTHRMLHRLSDSQVEQEIGRANVLITKAIPGIRVDVIAYPGGFMPHNRKIIKNGSFAGVKYANSGGLLAAWRPAYAPTAAKLDKFKIERILAQEGPDGSDYWLDMLKKDEPPRYISDGDVSTVSVPVKYAKLIDKSKLAGATVRTYEEDLPSVEPDKKTAKGEKVKLENVSALPNDKNKKSKQ